MDKSICKAHFLDTEWLFVWLYVSADESVFMGAIDH